MPEIRYAITADNSDFVRRMTETRDAVRLTTRNVEASGNDLDSIFRKLESGLQRVALAGAGAFTAQKAIQFARECVNVRAQVQSLETSFSTLLGGEEKAASMIREIREFAATTPMDMSDLAKGAQTMLGFNMEAEKVMPMLRAIGDISMGDAQKFESLSLAFSQMSATGKLMGQDLLQMINAGFNPLAEISVKTGKSIGELKEEMEAGKISVEMVTDAFISATAEGGKFHDMLKNQAQGIAGAQAYLRGAIADMMNEIGESMQGVVVDATNMAAGLVKNYKEVAETIAVLVASFGAYKAAVIVTSAMEMSHIARLRQLVLAKNAAAAAVGRLNAALMANPYGIALAAIVALTYGVYKLASAQTEAEKVAQKAKEASSRLQGEYGKEIRKLDELKKELEHAKKGSQEWQAAKDEIVSRYGQYDSRLSDEIEKTGTLASCYDALAESIRKTMLARAMEKYDSENDVDFTEVQQKASKGLEGTFTKWEDTGYKDEWMRPIKEKKTVRLNDESAQKIRKAIADYMAGADMQLSDEVKNYLRQIDKNSFTGNNIFREIEEKRRASLAKREGGVRIGVDFGFDEKEAAELWTSRGREVKPKGAAGEKTRDGSTIDKEIKAKKEELEKHKVGTAEWKKLDDEIQALEKERLEYGDYDRDHKKKSGPTAGQIAAREENAEGKLADILRKQAAEKLRADQDYEFQRWQNRVNLMEEGEAKVLAQMKLDHEREKTELDRRKDQELEAELQRQMAVFDAREKVNAAADKKYAKKTFRDSDIDQTEFDKIEERYAAMEADLTATQQKAEADRLQASKDAMDAYLKEFGNYQQKREAILREYEDKISEAQTEGERMTLTARRDREVSDLDYSEWIDTGKIALAFGDISKLSDSTVAELIADMERYREKVIDTFDPQKISEYEEALGRLREVQADNSFGIFSSVVPEYFKQRRSVATQKDSAAENVNALEEKRIETLEKIKRLQDLIDVTGATGSDTSALKSQLRDANVELDRTEEATNKAKTAFGQLQEQWDNLNTPEQKFYGICAAVSDTAGMIQSLSGNLSGMLDAMGAGTGLADTLGSVMGGVKNIADGFANGGMIGGITAAAGTVMDLVGSLFAAGDKKHQKNIERLQEQIDALQKSYDKLGRAADDAFSTDASDLIDQQNKLLEQQKVLIKQQMAEEEAKKKTDSEKIKAYKEQLEEIDEVLEDNRKKAKEAIIGEDVKSAISEFAEAYASAWEDGTDAASKSMSAVKGIITSALDELLKKRLQPTVQNFYDKLAEYMGDGILEDWELAALDRLKAQMDEIAAREEEQYKMILDRYKDLDELKEELTAVSFDSVRDDFRSQLLDMEADAASFSDSFSDMLRNALVEGLMNEKYDLMLREWYDEFAEAMDDRTLTDEERDRLRRQYEEIVNQGIADRDAINDIVGGGSYSQTASQGGWETMGQDTAEELNGRFTAMTELQVIGNDLQQTQNTLTAQILATLQSMSLLPGTATGQTDPTLLAIKDMMFLSTGYLEDIRKYTKILNSVDERLAALNTTIDRKL